MPDFTVHVSDDDLPYLSLLAGPEWHHYAGNLNDVIGQLAHAAAEGVRRPGSWERGWLTQATGWPYFDTSTRAQVAGEG